MRTVLPRFTRPVVGCTAPVTRPSSVDLPAPFTPEDAGALARRDAPLEFVQHRVGRRGVDRGIRHRPVLSRGIDDRHVDEVDDVLAEPRDREPVELDRVAHRRLVLDELVRRLDAELRLRGARRSAAAKPRELLAHQVLPLRLGCRGHSIAFDALQHVRRVAALERLDHAVVHLPRVGAHLVEEPAIVGHHDERAGVRRPAGLHVAGEPGDALDVEVVGRLVEEDDVPVADEQRREADAAALTAREARDLRLPRDIRQQPADDVAHPRVARPHVLLDAADDGFGHGHAGVHHVGLVEHADADAAAQRHPPAVGLDPPGQELQQRRLAVAVAPHDADAIALVEAEGDLVEDGARRVFEVQALGAEEVCHVSTSLVAATPRAP